MSHDEIDLHIRSDFSVIPDAQPRVNNYYDEIMRDKYVYIEDRIGAILGRVITVYDDGTMMVEFIRGRFMDKWEECEFSALLSIASIVKYSIYDNIDDMFKQHFEALIV